MMMGKDNGELPGISILVTKLSFLATGKVKNLAALSQLFQQSSCSCSVFLIQMTEGIIQ